jgi:hypothetical protein
MPRRSRLLQARKATREMLGLTRREFAILHRLDTPERIQRFIFRLKQNFEPDGDTCHSVRDVLQLRRAHCIEAATLAACALWIHGEPPLLLDLQAADDDDHVVALFRRAGRWGAISKTNGYYLRWRDPVYRSLRELAMSYFHEYCNARHRKSLRTYSRPFDLRRLDPEVWATAVECNWILASALDATHHTPLLTPRQARKLTPRDAFERRIGDLVQYRAPRPKRARGRRARR